jgi:aldehyde:ferredoxin oxidoreductase
LAIWDEQVEIRDATHLWGMPTDATQEFIREELGDSKVRIACIGPAGERLVPFASVINERRAAGRGGAGAVMGSKRLKAVVVRGTRQVEVANSEAFRTAVSRALNDIARDPLVSKEFTLYGSHNATSALSAGGIIPWRNWQNSSSPRAKELFPETWREKFVTKDVRCAPPCSVKCGKITLVREGPSAGAISEGPDYEAVYSFGSCCDISDFAAIIEADALCDKYGLDVISMGVSIAFAMECYERGIINNSDTGGLELRFGRADLLARLIHDTTYRQGFGEVLSAGTKKMSEMFGKGSEAFAMHAKGLEIGGYDPRGAKSVALVYACGPRGGCHKASGGSNFLSRIELQKKDSPLSTHERGALVKNNGDKRVLSDSIIFCIFQHMGISDETTVELLNAATGLNWSIEELYRIGERGSNLERVFNVREGLRRSWDTLPPRLLNESPTTGPNQGRVVELDGLVSEFYRIRGWDVETGIPKAEKLNELGLGEIASELNSNPKAAADQ